ncbi:MAG: hypothetical protein GY786_09965 [Proteobacteria bacterium]|nr:hypothetical protein [Pseudomonadota bacterium]
MNEIVQFFPDADFIQIGDHYLPMHLTTKEDLNTPLDVFFPFSKGILTVRGADRIEFLNNMSTGDLKNWQVEHGNRTLFTNSHGKILFDTFVILFEDKLLIVTDPGEEQRLQNHLEQFCITEDIVFTVSNDEFETIYLINESKIADSQISKNGWQLFQSPLGTMSVFLVPSDQQPVKGLLETQSQAIGLELFDEIRPSQYFARSGADFNNEHLPQEASLEHAVSFNKGCYLGQEPISRIAFRGRVAKKLYTLKSAVPLLMEMKLTADEKEVGVITSGSTFKAEEGYFSLGYLKTSWIRSENPGSLKVGENRVEVVYPK